MIKCAAVPAGPEISSSMSCKVVRQGAAEPLTLFGRGTDLAYDCVNGFACAFLRSRVSSFADDFLLGCGLYF